MNRKYNDEWKICMDNHDYTSLADFEEVARLTILRTCAEAIQLACENEDSYMFFPYEWSGGKDDDGCGGPAVKDPLDIYFRLDWEIDAEAPTFKMNLREPIERMVDMHLYNNRMCDTGEKWHNAKHLLVFAAELQKMVDLITSSYRDEEPE